MHRQRHKCAALIISLLLAALIGGSGLWLHARQRQYSLSRQLINALVAGDDKQAQSLVEQGAAPNTRYQPTPVPTLPELVKQLFLRTPPTANNSPTALLIACGAIPDDEATSAMQRQMPDAPQLILTMLRHGANIEERDKDRYTPLLWAISDQRWNTASLLLDHGANVNAQADNPNTGTTDGATPLVEAAMMPTASNIVRRLLERGARVNTTASNGWTALHYAIEVHAPLSMVNLLIASGASVNAEEQVHGRTPLMLACMSHTTTQTIRLLLAHGARINVKDWRGRTPLMEAAASDAPAIYIEVVRLLLTHGAKVNVQDERGLSPLMYAHHVDTVRLLLAHGADPNQTDENDKTALMLAQMDERSVIAALLKHYGARK
jgi:ankyrin repeat protein